VLRQMTSHGTAADYSLSFGADVQTTLQ
jgi:hypothetical protein